MWCYFLAHCWWLAAGTTARAPIISCLQQQQPFIHPPSSCQPAALLLAPPPPPAPSATSTAYPSIPSPPTPCKFLHLIHTRTGWVYMDDQVSAFERKYTGKHSNCICCRGYTSANRRFNRKYIVILVSLEIPSGTCSHGVVTDAVPSLCLMMLMTRV